MKFLAVFVLVVAVANAGIIEDAKQLFDSTASTVLSMLQGTVDVAVKHAQEVVSDAKAKEATLFSQLYENLQVEQIRKALQQSQTTHPQVNFSSCQQQVEKYTRDADDIVASVKNCSDPKIESLENRTNALKNTAEGVLNTMNQLKVEIGECYNKTLVAMPICFTQVNAKAAFQLTVKMPAILKDTTLFTVDVNALEALLNRCKSGVPSSEEAQKKAAIATAAINQCVNSTVAANN